MSLDGSAVRRLELKNYSHFQYAYWEYDSFHLYAGAWLGELEYSTISEIDLAGNASILVKVPRGQGWFAAPRPSPDGRYLAYTEKVFEMNVTMIEHF